MLLVAVLALLAVVTVLLVALFRQQGRILIRVTDLEQASASPVAAPALPYRLVHPPVVDTLGLSWTVTQLTSAGRPAVLLFVDRNCSTCAASLAGLLTREDVARAWLLVASEPNEWSDLPENVHVLVDQAGILARACGVRVVPSAVFVEPDGWVRTSPFVGPDAIHAALDADPRLVGAADREVRVPE
jgi:hypothetical protein